MDKVKKKTGLDYRYNNFCCEHDLQLKNFLYLSIICHFLINFHSVIIDIDINISNQYINSNIYITLIF